MNIISYPANKPCLILHTGPLSFNKTKQAYTADSSVGFGLTRVTSKYTESMCSVRGLEVCSSKYTLLVGSSRGLGLWKVPKKYIEPAGISGGLGIWPS